MGNLNRRLTNFKGQSKDLRKDKSIRVSLRRNRNFQLTNHKGQSKDMRKDKSIRVSFRRNLNRRLTNHKDESFLVSVRRKDKWLKLLSQCKDKEDAFHKTLPQWLARRKHPSYSILRQRVQAAAQVVAQQTAQQTAPIKAHTIAYLTALHRPQSFLISL